MPFFIRTGKCLPATQTEARLVFRRPPRLGVLPEGAGRPEPNQIVVKLDPSTGIRMVIDAKRGDGREPEAITMDMEFADEGGEGATPYEVLLSAAMRGDSVRFTRQDAVEEQWRIMQPLLDAPPAGAPVREGHVGPGGGRPSAGWLRRLARPVGGVMTAVDGARAVPAAEPQSAAAPSPFPPIESFGFLSNCHTAALVAPDGAIAWLCVPSFDSPSVFGTILDRQAGYFRVGPFGLGVPAARAYEPGTNTLVTTWHTSSGWVVVRDALTMGPRRGEDTVTPHTRPPADEDGDHLLVRTIECIDGSVEMELVCEPVFDYGRSAAEWALQDGRHIADASGAGVTLRLCTDMAIGIEGGRARARHTLREGEVAYCSLSWAEDLVSPCNDEEAQARMTATTRFWRSWVDGARLPDHQFREPIARSILAIKGLTYMPTGATVAAPTTSLPETPGGERNWDYRYAWMRDATFTLRALHWLNLDWEAEEFMQFVADLEPNADGAMQIMYGIDGRRDLTESTRDDLSGYAGARPVRIGNGAFDQRQNDVYGAVLDCILLQTRRSQRLSRRLWPIVESQAECATRVWREPDQGIWEARGAPRHYVSSKLMSWVAMDRAAKIANIRGDGEKERRWRVVAEEIRADILEHGVDARGSLRQHYETDALDASNLLAAVFGFFAETTIRGCAQPCWRSRTS